MSSTERAESVVRTTLVLEVELPEFYAEDLRHDDPDWQRWLSDMGVDPADAKAVGAEILGNIGEVYSGLLTIEASGHKGGSEIVRTPVVMVGARAEDRPPTEHYENAKDLAFRVDEPIIEQRVLAKVDHARLVVLERFVRQLRSEFSGRISELAEQALQEARLAEDEAEKRYAPDDWERS